MKLTKTQTDNILSVIAVPYIILLTMVFGLAFCIFVLFRLLAFLYAVMATPLFILLEKWSDGKYTRAKLPELWDKCFANLINDWHVIMDAVANC